ncbi:MAG: MFS transporter, partial [Promethearchaeota archaeon]
LLYKQIKQYFDFGAIFTASFLFCGVGLFIIFLSNDVPRTILGLLIAGIGFGLFVPNSTVWITLIAPESSRGLVLSGFLSSLFLGQFLSPLVSQFLLKYFLVAEMFALSGLILVSIGIIYMLATLFLNSRRPVKHSLERDLG